jgi:hypothetical protein
MYLQSFPENVIVIQNIDEHLREFNKSYIIIKHYETHAARKVLELYTYSLEVRPSFISLNYHYYTYCLFIFCWLNV